MNASLSLRRHVQTPPPLSHPAHAGCSLLDRLRRLARKASEVDFDAVERLSGRAHRLAERAKEIASLNALRDALDHGDRVEASAEDRNRS